MSFAFPFIFCFIVDNPNWNLPNEKQMHTNKLELMMLHNCKAELQYLQNMSNNFLCDTYLRAKLDNALQMAFSSR